LKNRRAGYGKYVVNLLSQKLIMEYGEGYSRSNLSRMIRLHEAFPVMEIVKFEDSLKREFYTQRKSLRENRTRKLIEQNPG
jgi:hypothetical protein